MVIVTTEQVFGRRILEVFGLIMGVSTGVYPEDYSEALENLKTEAEQIGANAVVGLKMLYNILGGADTDKDFTSTCFIFYGTAVKIE